MFESLRCPHYCFHWLIFIIIIIMIIIITIHFIVIIFWFMFLYLNDVPYWCDGSGPREKRAADILPFSVSNYYYCLSCLLSLIFSHWCMCLVCWTVILVVVVFNNVNLGRILRWWTFWHGTLHLYNGEGLHVGVGLGGRGLTCVCEVRAGSTAAKTD